MVYSDICYSPTNKVETKKDKLQNLPGVKVETG